MALKFDTVKRKIVYKGRELADTQPDASVEDVVRQHALTIPELATANVEGPEIKDGLGTKG
jgi:PRTRC genetic system protein C